MLTAWAIVQVWAFRLLFVYLLWRLIRQGQIAVRQGQDARRRYDELDVSRLLMLEDLKQSAARQEARQNVIAKELETTKRELAHGVATNTAKAEDTITDLLQKLEPLLKSVKPQRRHDDSKEDQKS